MNNYKINQEKLKAYVEDSLILEFDSPEECMKYFNTYDSRKLESVEEMKELQGKYGFGLDGKWYHIDFSEALDVREEQETKNTVYLLPKEDGTWGADMAKTPPAADAVPFVIEGDYPASLFYARSDVNGSVNYEVDVCATQKDLIDSLNWLGRCRWAPLELWDYNQETVKNPAIDHLFDKAYKTKMDKMALDDYISSAQSRVSAAGKEPEGKDFER